MKKIPINIKEAWNNKNDAIILSTVSQQAWPNSIYASCVSFFDENKIIVANNFFDKTLKNIISGSKGALLFITKDNTSYQIKGNLNYFTEGEYFEDMKKWNPKNLPGHGAVVLSIEEIYSGAEKLY